MLLAAPNKGKTRFVDGDVAPAMAARGWRVVQASLVRYADAGRALQRAMRGDPDLLNPFARVSVSGGDGRTVYILDGFDSLDATEHHEALAAARSQIDAGGDRLLFLASTSDISNDLFGATASPWQAWAQTLQLPEFDFTYVAARLNLVNDRTGLQLGLPEAARLFARIDRMPGLFDWIALDAMVNGTTDLEGSLTHWALDIFPTQFQPELEQLQPLDHALLRMLSTCGSPSLYSRTTMDSLQEKDAEPVTPNRVKDSLRRLIALRLVEPAGVRGQYRLLPSILWVGMREHARAVYARQVRRARD